MERIFGIASFERERSSLPVDSLVTLDKLSKDHKVMINSSHNKLFVQESNNLNFVGKINILISKLGPILTQYINI